MLFLNACGTLRPLPPREEISVERVAGILEDMEVQERRVDSFYSVGTVSARRWYGESEAEILIAGRKDPFALKIEMTHSWGKPILHILVDGQRLEVLSFTEERYYVGPFTSETLSKFIPGGLDRDLAWGVLRGYPQAVKYRRYGSAGADRILLFDGAGTKVEEIRLGAGGRRAVQTLFPERKLGISFSDFQETGDIAFAGVVRVDQTEAKQNLILRKKRVVFNRTIPEQIFSIKKPPDFNTYYLN